MPLTFFCQTVDKNIKGAFFQYEARNVYANQWVVEIDNATVLDIDKIAEKHGLANMGNVVKSYFLFVKRTNQKLSWKKSAIEQQLLNDPKVFALVNR